MNCPRCGSTLKIIPAGVSKSSGKSYSSFYACPNKCDLKGVMDTRVKSGPPEGFAKVERPTEQNGWQVVVEHLTTLESKVEELIKTIQDNILGQ